jgi:hypothetical protein
MRSHSWITKRLALAAVIVSCAGATAALASGATAHKAALTPVTVYFNPGSADGAGIEYCLNSGTSPSTAWP